MLSSRKPTILVVDDEKAVRDLVQLMLEQEGFTVFAAEGGKAAIKIASDAEVLIDILVTDILMPGMNGRDLANSICSIKPFLKVIFISAYTAELLFTHNLRPPGSDFLKKPFNKEALLDRISRVWASSPKWKDLVSKQA